MLQAGRFFMTVKMKSDSTPQTPTITVIGAADVA
jgi:hypothetical protein